MKQALVLGGTGTIGSQILREFAKADVKVFFTYLNNNTLANQLEKECGHTGFRVDLANPKAIYTFMETLAKDNLSFNIFVHGAGVIDNNLLEKTTEEIWQKTMAINCHSAFIVCQKLTPIMAKNGGGNIIFLGALDRTQSFKIPVCFAASQGALSTMAMALAKEVGPDNIRVNQIAVGFLENGMSQSIDSKLCEDFKNYSALKRFGNAKEIARAVLWFALNNKYINGKVIPINGGI